MFRDYIPGISALIALVFVATLLPIQTAPTDYLTASLPAAGQRCIDPVDGITNWWDADNISGTEAIDIEGAANGTMSDVSIVPGKVGDAFSFKGNDFNPNGSRIDRTGSFIRLPDNFFPYPTTQRGNNPFTFELWFKTNGDGVILGQQSAKPWDNHNNWVPAIFVGTDGDLGVEMFWDGRPPIYSNRSVKDNKWHHLAVVYDGTTETAYLDGANIGSTQKDQDPHSGGRYRYTIGTGATAGRKGGVGGWHSFKGEIDEFTIYDKALSVDEVRSIFDSGELGKCKLECGNNFIQGSEVCDGSDLAGETCETQRGPGFTGPLGCQSDCSAYDISLCDAPPLCSDGVDNDADGKIDFPSDPGCDSATDGDETDPPPPNIDRPVSFSNSSSVRIQILPPLGEREVLSPSAPCPTCTITFTPDISQIVGGTPAAEQGFITVAKIQDSSDNSISYTILAVNPEDPDKAYTEHTQFFTADGKEYTNIQR